MDDEDRTASHLSNYIDRVTEGQSRLIEGRKWLSSEVNLRLFIQFVLILLIVAVIAARVMSLTNPWSQFSHI